MLKDAKGTHLLGVQFALVMPVLKHIVTKQHPPEPQQVAFELLELHAPIYQPPDLFECIIYAIEYLPIFAERFVPPQYFQ